MNTKNKNTSNKIDNLISKKSDVLTVNQVAKKYQVPVSWVYEQTRRRHYLKNSIPCFSLGKHLRFFEHEVDFWIRSQNNEKIRMKSEL